MKKKILHKIKTLIWNNKHVTFKDKKCYHQVPSPLIGSLVFNILSFSLSKFINNILSVYHLMTSFITNTCMYYQTRLPRQYNSPVKSDLIPHAPVNVTIQGVIAYIGLRSVHPFYRDRALVAIKVILEEFAGRGRLPKELFWDFIPEAGGVLDGALVHLLILLQWRHMRVPLYPLQWRI